jgi:hypothetical protein
MIEALRPQYNHALNSTSPTELILSLVITVLVESNIVLGVSFGTIVHRSVLVMLHLLSLSFLSRYEHLIQRV